MKSLVWGNMKEIIDEDNSVPQERWVAEYGPTIMYRGFLGVRASTPSGLPLSAVSLKRGACIQYDRLWTMDTRALNHIMTHSADYQKPSDARRNLARILGKGERTP